MIASYVYELWDGKEVVGYFTASSRLIGNRVVIPTISSFKQEYGKRVKTITVPLIGRLIERDHQDITLRTVLDVRKKSKKQIQLLQTIGPIF